MGFRKRSWSDKEDQLLGDKVIQYMQSGKTQLEAFKDVAKELNRTPAACGYRWNANIRNDYQEELEQAKQGSVSASMTDSSANHNKEINTETASPLQVALQYLQRLEAYHMDSIEKIQDLGELKKENEQLKKQLAYFEQAYSHAFPSIGRS